MKASCTNQQFNAALDYSSAFQSAAIGHDAFKVSVNDGARGTITSSFSKTSNTDPFITQWSGFAFNHPGILSSAKDLSLIRTKIDAGTEPQASQFGTLLAATPTAYTPRPVEHPCAGILGASSKADANTAYAFALIGALNGNLAYTRGTPHAAESILDQWSAVFQGDVGACWYLCTGWVAPFWAEAAELARATDVDSSTHKTKWAGGGRVR